MMNRLLRYGRRFALPLMLLPFFLGFCAYWVIVIVDPYDLRAGGVQLRLADHRYPDREWPLLINSLTKQRHDLVLIGGSTTMAITPTMMRKAFPWSRAPINLSYIAPRPLDLGDMLKKISRIKGLRRVVVVMDFTLMEQRPYRSATGDTLANMETTSWHHGGDFSPQSALASFNLIVRGFYTLPGWEKSDQPEFMRGAQKVTQSERNISRFRAAVKRHQGDAFASAKISCSDIPFVDHQLAEFLNVAKAKGIAVDLAFPALPYMLHYDWIENRPRFGILKPGPIFDQFMTFKKCAVAATGKSGIKQGRVLALDSNDAISGNLNRYMDSAHLMDSEAYMDVAEMIAAGDYSLTPANIDAYESALRRKVVSTGRAF
jgi:hypothetical protein